MKTKVSRISFAIGLSVLATVAVPAADHTIGTASDIALQCYAVGDRVTVSDGSAAAVLGDGIATLSGSVVTMTHAGFTLLQDDAGTEYVFGVYETPAEGGDVFFFDWTESNNYDWATAPWTNLTGTSSRSHPDHADDVAMIRYARSDWGYLTVPAAGVTLGQLVVGMTKSWTLNNTVGTTTPLVFERTDDAAPRIALSRPDTTTTGDIEFRLGEDGNDGGNTLALSFAGDVFEVDWCGDSLASAAYARKRAVSFVFGRGKITTGAGQTVRFRNGSRNTVSDSKDNVNLSHGRLGSGIFGAGTVEAWDVYFECRHSEPDAYFAPALFRSMAGFDSFGPDNNTTRFTTRFDTVPSVPMEILSGRCPTNLNALTTFQNYWKVGVADAWLPPSFLLSGCNYVFIQNDAYAPHGDFYDATNKIDKLVLRGHVGFYGHPTYSPDGGHTDSDGVQRGRVIHHIDIENLELFDPWPTAQCNGLNFNRSDSSNIRTNDVRGTLSIANWSDFIRRPEGVDASEYDGAVYAIIPWMTVHCNDNNQQLTDMDWGQEQTFPGVREEDGCVRLLLHQSNRGSSTLSSRGENDNFYFYSKQGFHLNEADRRLFSLVYCTEEMPPWAAGGNFYLDSAKGGHKLTITSGAMAVTRNNKWLGQPVDMTRNGRIVLEGAPSYLHVPATGLYFAVSGSSANDYSMCWVPLVAANDLVKGGAGSIGLAGDQRGIQGTLVVNGGELFLGYPAYKKNGYLYNYGHPTNGWPMHGCATDCDFRVRGGAVLALSSAGYTGVDSDGNAVDEPVLAWGKDNRHTIVLETSGNSVGGIYIAEGVEATVFEACYGDESGEEVTFARGTWGSSESTAENVDDRHFSGPGTLMVQHDRIVKPTVLMVL